MTYGEPAYKRSAYASIDHASVALTCMCDRHEFLAVIDFRIFMERGTGGAEYGTSPVRSAKSDQGPPNPQQMEAVKYCPDKPCSSGEIAGSGKTRVLTPDASHGCWHMVLGEQHSSPSPLRTRPRPKCANALRPSAGPEAEHMWISPSIPRACASSDVTARNRSYLQDFPFMTMIAN